MNEDLNQRGRAAEVRSAASKIMALFTIWSICKHSSVMKQHLRKEIAGVSNFPLVSKKTKNLEELFFGIWERAQEYPLQINRILMNYKWTTFNAQSTKR